MKKLSALIVAVVLLLTTFIGCGKKEEVGGESADFADGVTVSEDLKEVYVGSKEGKKRIKISFTDAGYGNVWIRVIATHFVKDNPEYWVYLNGDPYLTDSVATQLSTGINLPDIYMPLSSSWQAYARAGWLEELSDVYDKKTDDGRTVYEKMGENWQRYCIATDKGVKGRYAFPWTEGVSGIVYNATMFEQNGWKIPETFDELIALCDKIKSDTNGRVSPFVYPGSIGGYFDYLGMTYWMQASGTDGVKQFYEYSDAEVFNPEKEPRKGLGVALGYFTKLFGPDADYSLTGSMSKNHTEAQIAFLQGKAAMIINASWMEREMINDIPEGTTIGMMRFPYIAEAKKEGDEYKKVNYSPLPDYMIIPKQAAEKEGAKKFLAYLAGDKMLQYFFDYTSALMPFDFMPDTTKASQFAKDCIAIWSDSETYFDLPTGRLGNFVNKFVSTIPYNSLVYGVDQDGTTVSRWMNQEYSTAKSNWAYWTSLADEMGA
ncbi:MAG: extracellular solute-binding protein [Clostridiales bacterium]|nr:extracellular solute-binding protein [Clostridiales bacterium]